ncbi:MAG: hypothetical protein ACPF8V_11880, partial [Luteibaculum sp.]
KLDLAPHILSHQKIHTSVWFSQDEITFAKNEELYSVDEEEFEALPKPQLVVKAWNAVCKDLASF